MLYTGYTKTELEALLVLLDKIEVPYEVLMEDGQAAERSRQRGDSSILRVDIPDDALITISPDYYGDLERFRIYPQYVDVPLEYFAPTPKVEGDAPKKDTKGNFVKWVTLVLALGMILMVLARVEG